MKKSGFREKWNEAGTDVWIAAAVLLVLGLLLLIFPAVSGSILCYLIGALFCIYGMIQIVAYFNGTVQEGMFRRSFAKGLVVLVCGIALIVKPELLAAILPVIFGCILVVGGIFKLQIGLDLMRMGNEYWYLSVVFAAVICILGIISIVNPFGAIFGLMRFIGIALILEGITDGVSNLMLDQQKKSSGFHTSGAKDEPPL